MTTVLERAVHSVHHACLIVAAVSVYVYIYFPCGLEGGIWDLIVLYVVHCFFVSIYQIALRYNALLCLK